MKNITKFSIIATIATLSATAAFADDQQLQNRLAFQRQIVDNNQSATTIAFYGRGHGLGQRFVTQDERPELRFKWRTNAKGIGIYVPVKQLSQHAITESPGSSWKTPGDFVYGQGKPSSYF